MNGSDPDCTTLRCMHPVKDALLAGWLRLGMDMKHEAFTGHVHNSHDSELTKDLTLEACSGKLFSLFRQAVQPVQASCSACLGKLFSPTFVAQGVVGQDQLLQ